jgi:transposase
LDSVDSLSREQLIQVILDQHRMIEQLRAEIEQLKRRGGAAPFSKGRSKPNPKPPGRKPGQGFFRFRNAPEETPGTEAIEVSVAALCCPACGGEWGEAKREVVTVTDIAEQPRPEVRRYSVEVRGCRQCGRKMRGRHPDIAPGQHGATAHRVGARLKAMAHALHYLHGVPVRKTPAIIEDLTGVRLTQGALTQDAMKQAGGAVGASYEALRALVRRQPVVHTDDTGWRVAGKTAFLMAFVNPSLSVYQVRPRHRNEEVRELIPAEFSGVMICDRGRSYDAAELESVAQQKCLAHLIRNAGELTAEKTGHAREFGRHLKDILQRALLLNTSRNQMQPGAYRKQIWELDQELTAHLRNRRLRDRDCQRLLNGAGAQHDRGHVLRFLREGVEPTNNRAERDLRPAVIARKVSHCSKNERGARAFEAFVSVLHTFRKLNPISTIPILAKLIASQPAPS